MVNKKQLFDLLERVVLTFVGAFAAVYIAAFSAGESDIAFLKDPELFNKAGTAGIAAMVPLVSGLIGMRVGDQNNASVITVKHMPSTEDEFVDSNVPMDNPAPIYPEVNNED